MNYEPCWHSWHRRRGHFYGQPAVFKLCRHCKAFRWHTLAGVTFERQRATWSNDRATGA